MEPLRVVVFAAKSTADQKGSITDQVEACREYAARQGWAVEGAPEGDEAASAYSGNRGPGLERAMARAEDLAKSDGRAGLLVWHSNRIARGGGNAPDAARHLAEYLFWAQRANVELHSVQDEATFSNPILAVVMGEMAHQESKIKAANVRKGMARRRARRMHTGGAIFGYVRDPDRGLAPNPEQAPTVERIFRMTAAGKSQPQVVATLNREGSRPLRGKAWTQGSLSKLLRNRTYLGEIQVDGEWVDAAHHAIVPRDVWEAATRQREAAAAVKGRKGGPRPKADHLLTGRMLRHATCQHAMTPVSLDAKRDGTVTGRYECSGRKAGLCDGFRVDMETVDEAIVGYLAEVGIDVDESLRLVREADDAQRSATESELAAARRDQASVEAEADRMWAKFKAGTLDDDDWRRWKTEHAEEKAASEARVQRLEARAEIAAVEPEATVPAVADALSIVRAAMSNGDRDAVRAALDTLFSGFWIGSTETMPEQTFIASATEQRAARKRWRKRLASLKQEAGRTVADTNAEAMAEEAAMNLPQPPPDADEPTLSAGIVVVPQPREDAVTEAKYLVDDSGKPMFKRIPIALTNNDAFDR